MPSHKAARREPHTVIIARGDRIRHFTLSPWIVGFLGSALAALAIGYLLATSYLVLRDDLIGATAARQARMQQAYEDRISLLRTQVDRITSRQMLDQQLVQGKVAELLARQSEITQRHGQMTPILERATGVASVLPERAPLPEMRPVMAAGGQARHARSALDKFSGAAADDARPVGNAYWQREADRPDAPIRVEEPQAPLDKPDEKADLFDSLGQSLAEIEAEQMIGLRTLASETYETVDAIRDVLVEAGLPVDADFGASNEGIGGPLVGLDGDVIFEERVRELEEALGQLESLRQSARSFPILNPSPGQAVSSSFGMRRDPFLRRPRMHAGIDFRGRPGTPILSTAPGRVIRAGWAGGYGRLVEVDHGNGWTTRYAHMSRIAVKTGDRLDAGDEVGGIGSTGRSTGPHLHYEIRRNGKAIDPVGFLRAGNRLADLI